MDTSRPTSAEPAEERLDERTVRLRLDIAYDGTDFSGWASQPGLRTVQGVLEEWIGKTLRLPEPVMITCAGRTDAGVHARGQVAHVDIDPGQVARPSRPGDGDHDLPRLLLRRLTRALPDDVAVRDVTVAPPGFDARFAATQRRYTYRIADGLSRQNPLLRSTVTVVPDELDVSIMNAAATSWRGLHDFAAFCKRREGATTIRTLTHCEVTRTTAGERAGTIEVDVRADAFCHSMVRSLVGALVAVGTGRRDLNWAQGLLQHRDRSGDISVMPARGLCLEEVSYPPDDQLVARVHEARATREPLR
ncbi:tRNA pseudouridine(38-40) synthase TruA [Propionibacteriaceae bacterium Y2011]